MKVSSVLAAAALAAGTNAAHNGTVVTTTIHATKFTTFCPVC